LAVQLAIAKRKTKKQSQQMPSFAQENSYSLEE
jgi:hypothetical protein